MTAKQFPKTLTIWVVISIVSILLAACAAPSADELRMTASAMDLTATNAPTTSVQPSATATLVVGGSKTSYTGVSGRKGDEINVSGYGSPSQMFSADQYIKLMTGGATINPGEEKLLKVYPEIRELDRAFEAKTDLGYQYRVGTSFSIPAAPSNTRVLWLSTSWAKPLPAWLNRLSCDGENPCIVLVDSSDVVTVNWSGRGVLLDRPLTALEVAAIKAYNK